MPLLPDRPNLKHLKKQAKDLLRACRGGDPAAIARFAGSRPSTKSLGPDHHLARAFRLHHAQSCIAREYGFASWDELTTHVEVKSHARRDEADRFRDWLALVYGGVVTGSLDPARPRIAALVLADAPDLAADDPYAACAAGNEALIQQTSATDPDWVNRPGGPFALPPLAAVTHSSLGQIPAFRDPLYRSAQALLKAGADPNQAFGNRFPPASLASPSKDMLSALYGAAGFNRDPALTTLLLDAGADPNDGESLYHSLEQPACTLALLSRGARVSGTNALRRALDMTDPTSLELLLAHGGDPNESASGPPTTEWGAPLLRAIAMRRSPRHIEALLRAGADPSARTPAGIGAYRLALQTGMPEVAAVLRAAGAAETLTEEEEFVAACARGDAEEARRIQDLRPDLPGSLPEAQLRLLPDTVAWGSGAAARVMVGLGWPIAVPGGDWKALALNLAVLRGDAGLTDFLLAHGASWRERHGYGDDVIGTLSWTSINQPVPGGDWAACAQALVAHGLPPAAPDPSDTEIVVIDGRRARFSAEVTEVLLEQFGA